MQFRTDFMQTMREAPETAPRRRGGSPGEPTAEGGCACGACRYRLDRAPLFVHCCHCTRCQRETGGPFAHHLMIEFSAMTLLQGTPETVKVPTDSGNNHWVFRCPGCRSAMWNEHGSRRAVTRYVRVGTLDEPGRFAPLAHIYVRSKQPWVLLGDVPAFEACYDSAKTWPPESLKRWQRAKAARESATAARAKSAAATVKPGKAAAR
jgi:hypothetical protein